MPDMPPPATLTFQGRDVALVPVLGGYRVTETKTHHIEVHQMLSNWRVLETPKGQTMVYDRFWCFQGRDPVPAVLAVLAWDAADGCAPGTEPVGWVKNWRGEYRGLDERAGRRAG